MLLIKLIYIRKWLNEYLEKGFIQQSKAKSAASLYWPKNQEKKYAYVTIIEN
jgi:hypothetical protein